MGNGASVKARKSAASQRISARGAVFAAEEAPQRSTARQSQRDGDDAALQLFDLGGGMMVEYVDEEDNRLAELGMVPDGLGGDGDDPDGVHELSQGSLPDESAELLAAAFSGDEDGASKKESGAGDAKSLSTHRTSELPGEVNGAQPWVHPDLDAVLQQRRARRRAREQELKKLQKQRRQLRDNKLYSRGVSRAYARNAPPPAPGGLEDDSLADSEALIGGKLEDSSVESADGAGPAVPTLKGLTAGRQHVKALTPQVSGRAGGTARSGKLLPNRGEAGTAALDAGVDGEAKLDSDDDDDGADDHYYDERDEELVDSEDEAAKGEGMHESEQAVDVSGGKPTSNIDLGLPPGLARIVTYHDAPHWRLHSTIALQVCHGPAVLVKKELFVVDPRFGSVGIWIGTCKTPTCFPLPNKLPIRPCNHGAGTDSLDTLIEDCEMFKSTVAKQLRSNNVTRQAAQREQLEIEGDKDDQYWFSLRMYKPELFATVQEQRGRLKGLLLHLSEDDARLAKLDEENDKAFETFSERKGLVTAFQVEQHDTALITGMAVDFMGNVWIVDHHNLTIKCYHRSGTLLKAIHKEEPPHWTHPYAIAVNDLEQSITVTDAPPPEAPNFGQGTLTKYTYRGKFLGASSRLLPIREPTGIAIDPANQLVFVSDTAYQKVWVLHSTGLYIVAEVTSGVSVTKQFLGITGVCYTPDNCQLHILDRTHLEVHQITSTLVKGRPEVKSAMLGSMSHPPGSSGKSVVVHYGDPSTRRKILVLQ